MSTWKKILLIIEVLEVRLRFIAILVAMALLIGYWDTIQTYWNKYTRPATSADSTTVDRDHEFFCPMHPKVVRAGLEPNGDVPKCPICGMPLSLRKKGESPPLPGDVVSRVQLSPDRVQLAGIQTVDVGHRLLARQITTVGNVRYDESRLSRVVSRVSGYVEELYVDKTFMRVEQGDRLAEIYSPELYNAAQELRLAVKHSGTSGMAASARKRLRLLGVDEKDVDAVEKSDEATSRLTIRSPTSGYVIGKPVQAGSRVEQGMTLLEIADLSAVWIEADVYASDISLVRAGEQVDATVESMPNRVFACTIALVYPTIDVATRTTRVRFTADNKSGELRPGMYATVRIHTPLGAVDALHGAANEQGELLAVPERAVIDTGARKVVYVEREPGMFDGVEVELGPRVDEWYPVLKGLQAGDRVAAAGAFLIDAETRLNPAAASTYFGASGGPKSAESSATPATPPAASSAARRGELPADAKTSAGALSPGELENIAKLPKEDRAAALAQKVCPITGNRLGTMGVPVKIVLNGQAVYLCCSGCEAKAKQDPEGVLKRVAELRSHHD